MIKSEMNPKVGFFFEKEKKWKKEIDLLRKIILACGLEETLKWGVPCYTFENKNVVLIHVFKEYCAVLFFKGALVKDPDNILIQQTENVQAARQARLTSVEEVKKNQKALTDCIKEAIEIEKAGLKVPLKKTKEFDMPEDFKKTLDENPEIKKAFKALTPGRQRGYLLYFSSPKQSKTRVARIEKSAKAILDGKGLND